MFSRENEIEIEESAYLTTVPRVWVDAKLSSHRFLFFSGFRVQHFGRNYCGLAMAMASAL